MSQTNKYVLFADYNFILKLHNREEQINDLENINRNTLFNNQANASETTDSLKNTIKTFFMNPIAAGNTTI